MTTGRIVLCSAAFLIFGALIWLGLDQASWWLSARESRYFTSLGAISAAATAIVSAIAALGVMVYVVITFSLWQETRLGNEVARRTNEAALMSQLMVEYDQMRDDVRLVIASYGRAHNRQEAVETFRRARTAPDQNNEIMTRIDPARFRISRFFVRLRKLANAGFLSRRIIFLALNRAAIEDVFLACVDPLDQVITVSNTGRDSLADRTFYQQLLDDRDRLDS
jgi:hypothetical protein